MVSVLRYSDTDITRIFHWGMVTEILIIINKH